jgi:hypothetical protein
MHTGDHIRRGVGLLTPEVYWLGIAGSVVGMTTIVLVLMGHRFGPWMALGFGLPNAIGIAAVHVLPRWSSFSDAFPGHVGALSWIVVLVEITGSLALAAVGAATLASRRAVPLPAGGPRGA